MVDLQKLKYGTVVRIQHRHRLSACLAQIIGPNGHLWDVIIPQGYLGYESDFLLSRKIDKIQSKQFDRYRIFSDEIIEITDLKW